jgi:hypothetical protein
VAAIETVIDTNRRFTVHTITGEVSHEEISNKIKTYSKSGPTDLILWDFSEADLSKIALGHVETFISLTNQYSSFRNGGKTAFVFSSDLGYGLGRVFDSRLDLMDSKIPYMTFRSKEDALMWLFSR